MPKTFLDVALGRRLSALLVFRAVVATGLLIITLAADLANWQTRLMSVVLYGVVVANYLVVFILGLLLRAKVSPVIVSTVHLATAVMAAAIVVQGTGGVESGFTFLHVLVILDAAIVGSRGVALVVATSATLAFGTQLSLQLYGIFPAGLPVLPPPSRFIIVTLSHIAAFYVTAWLAGHLSLLVESARQAAALARIDLSRAEMAQGAILEALPVGVITLNAKGYIITANEAAAKIWQQKVTQLIGQVVPNEILNLISNAQDTHEVEIDIQGRKHVLSLYQSIIQLNRLDEKVQSEELKILVFEDRTEIRSLEKNLQDKARLASIGEMGAAIAHELRNPLAAISGSVELLSQPISTPADNDKLKSIILREIERLNILIEDFLVYARPSQPDKISTNLSELVHETIELIKQDMALEATPIDLQSPSTLYVFCDKGQIQQMLWNVVRNAVEASQPGQPVKISLASISSTEARICVRDYGNGFAPEIRNNLFEPFQTTKSSGTGLGLAIVHRIVQAHQGKIQIDNVSPQGSEVTIWLPMS